MLRCRQTPLAPVINSNIKSGPFACMHLLCVDDLWFLKRIMHLIIIMTFSSDSHSALFGWHVLCCVNWINNAWIWFRVGFVAKCSPVTCLQLCIPYQISLIMKQYRSVQENASTSDSVRYCCNTDRPFLFTNNSTVPIINVLFWSCFQ